MKVVNSVERLGPVVGWRTGVCSFISKTPPVGKSCKRAPDGRRAASTGLVGGRVQAMGEMRLNGGPLAIQDAVHAGVAQSAVAGNLMLPQYPVQFCTQPQDGGPALLVEEVGAEFHGDAAQLLEGICQKQQLALRVHGAALHLLSIPRRADFH